MVVVDVEVEVVEVDEVDGNVVVLVLEVVVVVGESVVVVVLAPRLIDTNSFTIAYPPIASVPDTSIRPVPFANPVGSHGIATVSDPGGISTLGQYRNCPAL